MGKSEEGRAAQSPGAREIDQLCINTIRTLAMDAVQKANSGHPGTPMALAPLAYVLYTRFLRHNPRNPQWFNRDRFVLSCGHASMLLYAVLHLTGYDLSLEDIRNFRQWESRTPGHPEYGLTPGVETTTGPLGQGAATSVGMAIAEAHMAAVFNRDGHNIVDHFTYAFCSDGDLMEGVSHEAASLAGHLGLGKLIWFYDDNHITIEGPTDLAYSDDAAGRFEGYNWHVQDIGEKANDLAAVSAAIERARAQRDRPSLIIVRSHIACGSPNMQDTSKSHGAPLGEEEVALTKQAYGWPADEKFLVPAEVSGHMGSAVTQGNNLESEWETAFAAYRKEYPDLADGFERALRQELPEGWDAAIPKFDPAAGSVATRDAGGKVLNAIAEKVPWLAGGSADLSPSTKTLIASSGYFAKDKPENRNIAFGVREHAMCAVCSGMYLHGGLRPYGATFFVFSDYARPSIRLAALMKLPVIYIMTHDSIGVGEDGPTHQPIAHLASFRAIPNVCVIRPADANETAAAWRAAMERTDGPTMLALSRQKLPTLDPAAAPADGLPKGAYVLAKENGTRPDVILIATGSEVHLALAARDKLSQAGIDARVVSMPSWELFRRQPREYRDEVLPPSIRARLAVEAGVTLGWHEWVGDGGEVIAMTSFGASAPAGENFSRFGFTAENIAAKAAALVSK